MNVLRIGGTTIPYAIRRSASARERRITVTPGLVEVFALSADNDGDVVAFLDRKRQWLFDAFREVEHATANRHSVPRFMTGSKIPFRGRKVSLTVRRTDAPQIDVRYRHGFIVDLPAWSGRETDQLVAGELKLWLKRRVRRDVRETADRYRQRFDLFPRSITVAEFGSGWGSCGPQGNILINWHLIFAPRKVLDYVVAHELAHLKVRNHERQFWDFLGTIYPDWLSAKAWLERNQGGLDDGFLRAAAPTSLRKPKTGSTEEVGVTLQL